MSRNAVASWLVTGVGTSYDAVRKMRKELRFLFFGILAGSIAGVALMLATHQRHRGESTCSDANSISRESQMRVGPAPQTSLQITNQAQTGVIDTNATDDSISIEVAGGRSLNFTPAFVKAMRDLRLAGVSPETLATVVTAEFNRQWRDQMNIIREKVRRGELGQDESQDFFHSRNERLGQSLAAIAGDEAFLLWDQQRIIRTVAAASGLQLTEIQSNALYRVAKEHEQRLTALEAARGAGQIDPLDYKEQRRKLEEQWQQARKMMISADHQPEEVQADIGIEAGLRAATRELNLTPQQFAALLEATQKNALELQKLERNESRTNMADFLERQQAVEAQQEQDYVRILGADV
jgi:hypothetical protein